MFQKYLIKPVAVCALGGALAVGTGVAVADTGQELQLSLGSFKASGSDTGTISGEITYGKYVSPNWQLGVIQGINYAFIDDEDDVWSASTVGFANYEFGSGVAERGEFVPFIGAFLGGVYNSDDATGTLGPNLGFKYFVNDTTFITTRYRYEWFFDDLEFGSTSEFEDSFDTVKDNSSDGNHVISVGLGYRF